MSAFGGQLFTRILPPNELNGNRQLYELTEDLSYQSEILGLITVPKGFLTDFASIPRIVWNVIDPEDPCVLYPSVIHDALYSWSGAMPDSKLFTRDQADQVLREAMVICGARIDQRAIVYRMVRLFGGSHWKN